MKPLLLLRLLTIAAIGSAADKPNILLVMADDLGWGDVGFNGHPTRLESKWPAER